MAINVGRSMAKLDSIGPPNESDQRYAQIRLKVLMATILALGLAYAPNFYSLASTWNVDPNYSHGWLVFPIALVILWQRMTAPGSTPPLSAISKPWLGCLSLAVVLAVRALAYERGYQWGETATILPALACLVWSFGSWPLLKQTWPAIAFLVFMLPLPETVNNGIALPLQQFAASGSSFVLQLSGLWTVPEGNIINLRTKHTCELRLMSSVNDVSDIPKVGKSLIIVADVNHVLHFRVFDGDGKVVADTDEKKLGDQAWQIEGLRKQLENWWPPHELTRNEKVRGIVAVTSIIGHAPPPEVERLDVAAACNGLKMLMTLTATITATIILVPLPTWKRILLLVTVVPIALISNITRIVSTGWCYYLFEGELSRQRAHDWAGFMMMPLALLLVGLVLGILSWLVPTEDEPIDEEEERKSSLKLMNQKSWGIARNAGREP